LIVAESFCEMPRLSEYGAKIEAMRVIFREMGHGDGDSDSGGASARVPRSS
jgi:hypothetical protein